MSEFGKAGKGRPPSETQFGRGQRRAPGRPKGARGTKSIAREITGETHEVQLNGCERIVTTYELLLISMRNLAMEGDLKAAKWLEQYRERLGDEADGCGFLVVPEAMHPDLFLKKVMFENQFKTNPELWDDPMLGRRSDT